MEKKKFKYITILLFYFKIFIRSHQNMAVIIHLPVIRIMPAVKQWN
jgi:hypothetical protein